MKRPDKIFQFWPHIAAGFDLLACLLASGHALLHKRDTRSARSGSALSGFCPRSVPCSTSHSASTALRSNRSRREIKSSRSSRQLQSIKILLRGGVHGVGEVAIAAVVELVGQ